MDGQALDLPSESFDAVILHLILAVIPDPAACLREAARVLEPGGRITVFDKFLPDGERPALPRRLANAFTRTLFTDINRRMGDILERSDAPLRIEHDDPAFLGGAFRIMLLRDTAPGIFGRKARGEIERAKMRKSALGMRSSALTSFSRARNQIGLLEIQFIGAEMRTEELKINSNALKSILTCKSEKEAAGFHLESIGLSSDGQETKTNALFSNLLE